METVQDILRRKGESVATVGREATVLEAARLMNERRIGGLVVLEGEKVVGIITERDLLCRIVAVERPAGEVAVADIMTAPVAVCRPDTPLDECRLVMTSKRIRHLPVVEDGRLRGIVTIGDLMAFELNDKQTTIEYLNDYLYAPPTPTGQSGAQAE